MSNTPRTEAGRRLDDALEGAYGENLDATRAILAIENEAFAAAAAVSLLRVAPSKEMLASILQSVGEETITKTDPETIAQAMLDNWEGLE